MQYRDFGKTGKKISALGFGAMRLPMEEIDGKNHVKMDEAVALLKEGINLGINYIDTAYPYCEKESEIAVGKAIKGCRDNLLISSKLPMWQVEKREDFRKFLDEQLRKIDTDRIDFYHFHGIGKDIFENKVLGFNLIDEAEKAISEGLIKHISFSFHDKPEYMKPIIDTGVFSSVLCQYNLLDRSNEEMIDYASKKGLGVVVMGPVAGGRLGISSETIRGLLPGKISSSAEIAIRFVLANSGVSCALSGMGNLDMLKENAEIASRENTLSEEEKEQVIKATEENKRLSDLYCTGCAYCMPCPSEVNIPKIFELMNYHRVYNLTDYAKGEYQKIGKVNWLKGKDGSACVECGACEDKCPQKIPIIKQLKESHKALSI